MASGVLPDAMRAAELDWEQYKGTPDVKRAALKDDFKLLGQTKANDLAYVITEDATTLHKFCAELRGKRLLAARPIKVEDGFDKSHFDPMGQKDFDAGLGNEPEAPKRRILT